MSIRNLACILVLTLLGVVAGTIVPSHRARCRANEVDWRERYRYRMFLLRTTTLSSETELENTKQLFQRAVDSGYNCCVLGASTNLIQPESVGDEFLVRLRSLRDAASHLGLGLVPAVFPLDSDFLVSPLAPHLAEGLPVRDVAWLPQKI